MCYYAGGKTKNYISKVSRGTKIGILVDMYKGDLKFFINDVDQGYALQGE